MKKDRESLIEYKGFYVEIMPDDPNENTGKFSWDIWAEYEKDEFDCIEGSCSSVGFEKEESIRQAKEKIDNVSFQKIFGDYKLSP